MSTQDDYPKNPITGFPLFNPPTPILGVFLFIFVFYLILHFKDTKDNTYIYSHNWKSCGGYSIGDWISFDSTRYYKIYNDTLYKQEQAVALVVNIDKKLFGDNTLEIKAIKTGELGSYCEK